MMCPAPRAPSGRPVTLISVRPAAGTPSSRTARRAPPGHPSAWRLPWTRRRARRRSSRPPRRGCPSRSLLEPAGACPSRAGTGRTGRRGRGWLGRTVRSSRSGPTRPWSSHSTPTGIPEGRSCPATATPPRRRGSPPAIPDGRFSPRRVGVGHRCTEVGQAPRRPGRWPGLPRKEVGHGGPGVEGVAEAAQRDAGRALPPQVGSDEVEPQLRRAGRHRRDAVHHRAPGRVSRHQS